MTGTQTLIIRAAIGGTLGLASIVGWRIAPRVKATRFEFRHILLALFALSRIGLFALAFLILHLEPRGDIYIYMEEAAPALAGKLVYRDFITMHAPLDPYMLAGMLRLHRSPVTIVFFSVIFDILGMAVWLSIGQRVLSQLSFRRASILMLLNPTSLLSVAIDGQMNSLISLLLGLGVLALLQVRPFLSGIWVACSSAIVKFLTLIFTPGYFFASRKKVAWVAGFALISIGVYLPFALAGANLLVPLGAEGSHKTDNNAVFVFELLSGHDLGSRLPDAVLALSWACVVGLTAWAIRRHRENTLRAAHILSISLIAELMCIMVFSKNGWDRYLVMTMFPLCMLVAEVTFLEICAYSIWAAICVTEPSYWASILFLIPPVEAHTLLMRGDHRIFILACGETLEVAGSFLILYFSLRTLMRLGSVAIDKPALGSS